MTVFITIPWFSPAYKAGGPIQSIINLTESYQENISYKIFCSNKDLDKSALKNIKIDSWIKFSNNTEVYYTSSSSYNILKKEIGIINPDVLFIIGLFSWQFNILPILLNFKNKKILSVRGMLHPGALSQKSLKKKIFIAVLKMIGIENKLYLHATDETEAKYIKHNFGIESNILVANNFSKILKTSNPILKLNGELKLITIALISPMKNHLLILEALKKCKSKIIYTICGPVKDEIYWQLCLKEINLLPHNIVVNIVGEIIPSLIESEFSKNHVFIMPSKSENFGHSIAEALSFGMPVITSNFTPWNDLEKNCAGINVENNIDSIQNAVTFFAQLDQEVYNKFRKSTLNYFQDNNNLNEKKEAYKKMFSVL